MALLEVIVALTIVATVAGAALEHTAAIAAFERRAREYEEDAEAADRLLRGLALLTRGQLSERLGVNVVGRFAVTVRSLGEGLFQVRLADHARPTTALLETRLYAAELSQP